MTRVLEERQVGIREVDQLETVEGAEARIFEGRSRLLTERRGDDAGNAGENPDAPGQLPEDDGRVHEDTSE